MKQLVAYVAARVAHSPTLDGRKRRLLPSGLAPVELNRNETDYIHREIFELGAYLRHGITIEDGDTVLDVGGNIGLFSLFARQSARDVRLFVFEPNPHVAPITRANLSAYAPDARLFAFGLAEADRDARFTFFPGFSLLSGLYADAATEREVVRSFLENQARAGVEGAAGLAAAGSQFLEERFRGEEVPVRLRTLSSVLREEGIDRVHLLKVNVEKAELDVLRGIEERDWARIDQAVVEVDVAENREPILALFRAHDTEVHVEQDPLLARTELCYVYAVRRGSGRALRVGAPPKLLARVLDDPVLTVDALRERLARLLPAAMQPASYVLLGSLPVTANGKLDTRRLPAPEAREANFTAPRGELESRVARIWAEVLQVEQVGAHDNFFDLGGHSLLLTRVHARITAEIKTDLTVVELFQYPTVAGLAGRLGRAPTTMKGSASSAADGASRERGASRRAALTQRTGHRTRSNQQGETPEPADPDSGLRAPELRD
ncbi:MAG: FkbM family methyltransferase [Candidatus Eisenbacteria bacterium]